MYFDTTFASTEPPKRPASSVQQMATPFSQDESHATIAAARLRSFPHVRLAVRCS